MGGPKGEKEGHGRKRKKACKSVHGLIREAINNLGSGI